MPRRTSFVTRVRSLMRAETSRRAAESAAAPAPRPRAAPQTKTHDPSLEMLEAEARHQRSRLALYRARIYAGKPTSTTRLRELERQSAGADDRLRARRRLEASRSA